MCLNVYLANSLHALAVGQFSDCTSRVDAPLTTRCTLGTRFLTFFAKKFCMLWPFSWKAIISSILNIRERTIYYQRVSR